MICFLFGVVRSMVFLPPWFRISGHDIYYIIEKGVEIEEWNLV